MVAQNQIILKSANYSQLLITQNSRDHIDFSLSYARFGLSYSLSYRGNFLIKFDLQR